MLYILTIIGFTDDKEAAADEFIQNCEKQALLDLLITLPQEQQERFKQQIAGVTDQEQQKTIIAKYITLEQYKQTLQKASRTASEGLMKEIIPTLSSEQADKLQLYLNSLTTPVAAK